MLLCPGINIDICLRTVYFDSFLSIITRVFKVNIRKTPAVKPTISQSIVSIGDDCFGMSFSSEIISTKFVSNLNQYDVPEYDESFGFRQR
jgi:hypothetical protein